VRGCVYFECLVEVLLSLLELGGRYDCGGARWGIRSVVSLSRSIKPSSLYKRNFAKL